MSENNYTKPTKEEWKEREFGALWKRKSNAGVTYLTGKIDGKSVVVFASKGKTNENQPDFRIYLSPERNNRVGQTGAKSVAKPTPKPAPKKVVTIPEDDGDGIL